MSAAKQVIATSWSTRECFSVSMRAAAGQRARGPAGSRPAGLVTGTDGGGELLCVAAVTRRKGHDVLLAALAVIADLPWRCVCVGTLDFEPVFVEQLRIRAEAVGIGDRVCFPGPRIGDRLSNACMQRPMCLCWPRASSRTEWWSSPRLWLAGCRSSRRRPAGCRRLGMDQRWPPTRPVGAAR